MEKTMRFFIFNFKKRWPYGKNRQLIALLSFSMAFVIFIALGEIGYSYLPVRSAWHGDIVEPPNDKYIIAEAYSDHSDAYDMLYYGIGDALQNAKQADILLLG